MASILADGGRLEGASSEGAAKREAEQAGEGSSSGKDRPGLGEGGSQRKGKGGMSSREFGEAIQKRRRKAEMLGQLYQLAGGVFEEAVRELRKVSYESEVFSWSGDCKREPVIQPVPAACVCNFSSVGFQVGSCLC